MSVRNPLDLPGCASGSALPEERICIYLSLYERRRTATAICIWATTASFGSYPWKGEAWRQYRVSCGLGPGCTGRLSLASPRRFAHCQFWRKWTGLTCRLPRSIFVGSRVTLPAGTRSCRHSRRAAFVFFHPIEPGLDRRRPLCLRLLLLRGFCENRSRAVPEEAPEPSSSAYPSRDRASESFLGSRGPEGTLQGYSEGSQQLVPVPKQQQEVSGRQLRRTLESTFPLDCAR